MKDFLPNLSVSTEQLRSLVLEVVARPRSPQDSGLQIGSLTEPVTRLVIERGLSGAPAPSVANQFGRNMATEYMLSRRDQARVQNIVWDLIIEGILRPGLHDGVNTNLPFFHITEYGQRVIEHGRPSPYDPDGYLSRLKRDIPTLDAVVETYLSESLHTLRIGCLLSSTVTLGCASERALLLLIDAYGDALQEPSKSKFRKDVEGRMIKRQWDEFSKHMESRLAAKLPGNLKDDLEVKLAGVFSMIRNMRNEAGHPTGKPIDREQAYMNLVVFPSYLRRVYELIEWLSSNPV